MAAPANSPDDHSATWASAQGQSAVVLCIQVVMPLGRSRDNTSKSGYHSAFVASLSEGVAVAQAATEGRAIVLKAIVILIVLILSCVYRKLKLGRSGGEVRQGWRVI
jgi:hypothetical protein